MISWELKGQLKILYNDNLCICVAGFRHREKAVMLIGPLSLQLIQQI